ncbi:GNAT family N-acetyltransferase [Gallaecimonas kandeliae]|uniref:GNAT family N-acetyltransferase n=1 Tax=Gallaecimonas kandeliae TaxID=3029055 RepID=UPI002647FEA3|nr:GNAT family N-acetyltransferase [Gallaecimonas kandeliae]WKE65181.1 GNAT family N-acetyltransferase [Gallaecimonas kandeliae]
MLIKLASREDAPCLARYYADNAEHLKPWEPLREPGYHSLESWAARLAEWEQDQREGRAAYFLALDGEPKELVAVCNLTNIVRGPFQACYMGFSVAQKRQGTGRMKMLARHAIRHAFEELKLNRVMANHLPRNSRSAALLASLGFEREGLARRYLCINGRWEDHVLNALHNPANLDTDNKDEP